MTSAWFSFLVSRAGRQPPSGQECSECHRNRGRLGFATCISGGIGQKCNNCLYLGHGCCSLLTDIKSILLISLDLELKEHTQELTEVGIALQQLLVCLTSVQDARKASHKTSPEVFAMTTDSTTFQFIVLRSNRTVYVSEFLHWATKRWEIVLT